MFVKGKVITATLERRKGVQHLPWLLPPICMLDYSDELFAFDPLLP